MYEVWESVSRLRIHIFIYSLDILLGAIMFKYLVHVYDIYIFFEYKDLKV